MFGRAEAIISGTQRTVVLARVCATTCGRQAGGRRSPSRPRPGDSRSRYGPERAERGGDRSRRRAAPGGDVGRASAIGLGQRRAIAPSCATGALAGGAAAPIPAAPERREERRSRRCGRRRQWPRAAAWRTRTESTGALLRPRHKRSHRPSRRRAWHRRWRRLGEPGERRGLAGGSWHRHARRHRDRSLEIGSSVAAAGTRPAATDRGRFLARHGAASALTLLVERRQRPR